VKSHYLFFLVLVLIFSPGFANAVSVDGPLAVTSAEYRLGATIDPDVLPGVSTEIWARLYRPLTFTRQPHPLIIFLHGNHKTCGVGQNPIQEESCQYTFTGTCPSGQEVIQNHLGYDYLAQKLASWGYIVVSINANRGITCGNGTDDDSGLNLARGRLILKHLSLLYQWSTHGGAPSSLGVDLRGKLDFTQVGLMGHSRGGEGVRAAYNLYNDSGSIWLGKIPNLGIRGIFEIGPVDGQTSRVLDALGTAWNVLLPMCDGDVLNLEGMKPYDRMSMRLDDLVLAPKSMVAVWGANHNYYNTQWQTNDSTGCVGTTPLWSGDVGSASVRETAVQTVVPFFRNFVGVKRDNSFVTNEDPLNPIPSVISEITQVDRTYVIAPGRFALIPLESFSMPANLGYLGQPHELSGVQVVHTAVPEHDSVLRAAKVSWSKAGSGVYFQDNWAAPGGGIDLSSGATLDFRVSRSPSPLNTGFDSTDFHIQLVYADGSLGSPLALSQFALLNGPIGTSNPKTGDPILHSTLQTVRVPLYLLASQGGFSIRGVRFIFDRTDSGEIYLTDIFVSRFNDFQSAFYPPGRHRGGRRGEDPGDDGPFSPWIKKIDGVGSEMPPGDGALKSGDPVEHGRITRIERKSQNAAPSFAELEAESAKGFDVGDALPVLLLNGEEAAVGRYLESGDLHKMIFRVKEAFVENLNDDVRVEVGYREAPGATVLDLGTIKKSELK